jgi:putative PEP-CTERM system TPR-repeat lipoprotein
MTRPYSFRRAFATAFLAAILTAACGESPEALLTSAREYLAKNDNNAAVIQLRNALQKNPDLAEARFLLGKLLLESGDAAGAEKELQAASALQYPDEQVVPPWARSLVLIGDNKKVIDELSRVDIAGPDGKAELLTAVGQAYLAERKPEQAGVSLSAALTAKPEYVPAHLGQARISASAGNLPEASTAVDRALAIAPNNPDALQFKGDILLAQRQPEPALAVYRKAVGAKPGFLAGHTAIVSLLVQQRKVEDAAKQLEAMKQAAPQHPQTLYLQALIAYLQKDMPTAREAILQQLRAVPDDLRGLLLAGAIELELKSYGQAEMYTLKVLDHMPQQRLARRTLIMSYLRSGQSAKALEALKPVLNSIGKDANMLGLAGEVFIINGQASRAAEYFAQAAAIEPADPARRTSLALSRVAAGDSDRAFHDLEQAAASDSGTRADLALIATHLQRREYDKALAAINALEKKQPGTALPHSLRGTVLLAKRELPGARLHFERALQIDPMHFPAAASLAELDMAENKPDAARQRYESIVAKDPKHMQALVGLAAIRARTAGASAGQPRAGPDEEVVSLLNRAIAANPAEPAPRLTLIGYYVGSNDAKNGARAAQEAVAALPERPEVLDAAGRAYQAAGDTFQALKMYEKLASLQRMSPLPYLRMAEIHLSAKNKDAASDSLRKALEIKPDFVEAQHRLITLELDAGRTREALNVAQQVQKQRPNESVGYLFEGSIYAAQNKWTDAVTAYQTGLKHVESTDLAVRLHEALAAASGKEAEQFASTWSKNHPKDAAFRMHLAENALAKKDYGTAAQHYRKVLESQPDNALVLNNLAWVEGQLKNPKAVELAENANKLAPNQPSIMDTLGMLLIEKGDTARGLELLQKASTMAPQAAAIRLNLAKALIKTGQKDAARRELDELAKLGDKFSGQGEVGELRRGL